MASLSIAVIVPVGADEAAPSGIFFERLEAATPPVSIVAAADARIRPEAREAFVRAGAVLFTFEETPRGARLARVAKSSPSAEILVFLHADTWLPTGWDRAAREAIAGGAAGGAFRLGFWAAGHA